MNKRIPIIAGIVVVAAAAVYLYFNPIDTSFMDKQTKNENAAAIVNGEEILKTDLETRVAQNEQTLAAQGRTDVDKGELEKQTLDQMINEALVLQASTKANIAVSDSEVEERVQAIAQNVGGPEALAQELQKANLTEQSLRLEIKNQIITDKYLDSQIDKSALNVSDDEINAFYQMASAQQELPPVDQVKPQIVAQLTQQKQNQAVVTLVDKLRGEADIKILIEFAGPSSIPLQP